MEGLRWIRGPALANALWGNGFRPRHVDVAVTYQRRPAARPPPAWVSFTARLSYSACNHLMHLQWFATLHHRPKLHIMIMTMHATLRLPH